MLNSYEFYYAGISDWQVDFTRQSERLSIGTELNLIVDSK